MVIEVGPIVTGDSKSCQPIVGRYLNWIAVRRITDDRATGPPRPLTWNSVRCWSPKVRRSGGTLFTDCIARLVLRTKRPRRYQSDAADRARLSITLQRRSASMGKHRARDRSSIMSGMPGWLKGRGGAHPGRPCRRGASCPSDCATGA